MKDFINNMKMFKKLLSAFLLVALIAVIIGIVGFRGITLVDDADTVLYERMTVPIGYLGDIGINFQRVRINVRDMTEAETPAERQKAMDTIKELRQKIDEDSEKFERVMTRTAL